MTTQPSAPVDFDDIQGLLRFGYKHHTEAVFILLAVRKVVAARTWLASAQVASAVEQREIPSTVLQVAFTVDGLRAIGVEDDVIAAFSPEFVSGMTGESRERRLGDVGENDPVHWRWGTGARQPHVLAMLYALPGELASAQQSLLAACERGFIVIDVLSTADRRGREPFGFVDGISQPELDWDRGRPIEDTDRLEYSNSTCLGEFVLGYPNEYGGYTDRPLLDPQRPRAFMLPRGEDASDKADVGRNGRYLVMRELEQDVSGFWQFMDREAGGNAHARAELAAAFVGRTLDGEPLAETGATPKPGNEAGSPNINDFTFDADAQGTRCPLGAHVRRTNPRNADFPPGTSGFISRLVRILGFDSVARQRDLIASARFHRLLRRGRSYGDSTSIEQALSTLPVIDNPGLHFICLSANIARQFEFVQSAWVSSVGFDSLSNETDPLLGHRQPTPRGVPTDTFSIPQQFGPARLIRQLPQFVTVRGGAYFFLPGIRALRYLSGV